MPLKYILPIFILCVGLLTAQTKKIEFTEYDLANGLHVILHQDSSTPIIAITITYHVGSKNEDPQRTGFAHFFEHLMFEGSENIKRGQFDKYVQNAGGQLNAYTSFDETGYFLMLPSNQLELGLWLESERLLHAKIDSAGVETQRSVIKEERRQRYDNQPYGSLLEKVFSSSYKVHPYRWTPIGSFQYIDQATIDEFIDFYKMFYVPNNAVLSIAGDINIDETKKLIGKYFGDIPKGTKEIYRPTVKEPAQTAEVRDTVYDNIQLAAVVQAYHIPSQTTDDSYALSMLTTLLSDGQSSRLYKELVDKQRLAVNVASIPFSLEDPGLFVAYAIAGLGKEPHQVEDVIISEINRVQNELITENEFAKIRNQVESDFVSGNNRMVGIAQSLAKSYLFHKNTNFINTEIERYMKVTREDIKRVASQYLTDKNRTVLYYLPKSKKTK